MADKNNHYEAGRGKTPGDVTLTEAEQREKLEGYSTVPREFWPFIKYATHVRYTRKSGEFRTGGFVVKNSFDAKVGGETTKRCIQLQNGFYKNVPGYKVWDVAYDDIEYLYAKGSAVELVIRQECVDAIKKLSANVHKIVNRLKILEQRIIALEQIKK